MRVVSETGGTINVPLGGTLPAQQTGNVSLEGTLPAKVNGPLSEVVSSTSPLFAGVAASKTTSNTFTDPMNLSSLNGQEFTISVNGGTPQTVTIDAAKFSVVSLNTVTFAEFIAGVESQVNGITVTEAGGAFTFGTDAVGEKAQIKFDNKTGNPLTFFGLDTILTSEPNQQRQVQLCSMTSRSTRKTMTSEIRSGSPAPIRAAPRWLAPSSTERTERPFRA